MFSNPIIALVKMAMEYTRHALSRMRQRKISKRMVEDALKRPDLSFATRRGRVASLKRHGDKILKVISEKSNDKIWVVTVYWTRRIKKW